MSRAKVLIIVDEVLKELGKAQVIAGGLSLEEWDGADVEDLELAIETLEGLLVDR